MKLVNVDDFRDRLELEKRLAQDDRLHLLRTGLDVALADLEDMPDGVVRCRDCRSSEPCEVKGRVWCPMMCRYCKDDFYCAEGVRKDDCRNPVPHTGKPGFDPDDFIGEYEEENE
jgi:hypothetical protein